MALVFVLWTKKPWVTSALVSRKRTGVEAGTTAQCGTNIYCSAIMRTVIEPVRFEGGAKIAFDKLPLQVQSRRVDGFHIA